jgi:hypothetical protein
MRLILFMMAYEFFYIQDDLVGEVVGFCFEFRFCVNSDDGFSI